MVPLNRAEKECKVLKDLLTAVQDNPDSKSLVEKISDYETTIADYEVQVPLTILLTKTLAEIFGRHSRPAHMPTTSARAS